MRRAFGWGLLSVLLACAGCGDGGTISTVDGGRDAAPPDVGRGDASTDAAAPDDDADDDGFPAAVDCDDTDASVHPGAAELCGGTDDDCDAAIDEDATDGTTYYPDGDGDGFGDAISGAVVACSLPAGHVEDATDCDDTDRDVHPGATEVCNVFDDDCDGVADDDAIDQHTYHRDEDADGYGQESMSIVSCASVPPVHFAEPSPGAWDCDDARDDVHPGLTEDCTDVDRDCDGDPFAGATELGTYYFDADHDGYGRDDTATEACSAPSADYVTVGGDCNTADDTIHPGAADPFDGVDRDCDRLDGADARTVFVAVGCSCDTGPGTLGSRARPYCSLAAAVAAAASMTAATGPMDVVLSGGAHVVGASALPLVGRVNLRGGFVCTSTGGAGVWSDPLLPTPPTAPPASRDRSLTRIQASASLTTPALGGRTFATVSAVELSSDAVVQDLTIVGPNLSAYDGQGYASVALLARGIAPGRLSLNNVRIESGPGARGAVGTEGVDGSARGSGGLCSSGGARGIAPWECASGSGSSGGTGTWSDGSALTFTGFGGPGGGSIAGVCLQGLNGTAGFAGIDSDSGAGATALGSGTGTWDADSGWGDAVGGSGVTGGSGSGGGGGGSGYWSASGTPSCFHYGGQGGEGGGGGCGGAAGGGGHIGGASIGLLALPTWTVRTTEIALGTVLFVRGRGGDGGAGGSGGDGRGGAAGVSGMWQSSAPAGCGGTNDSGAGASGGRGGAGGGGGGGAGGNGGPSYAVVIYAETMFGVPSRTSTVTPTTPSLSGGCGTGVGGNGGGGGMHGASGIGGTGARGADSVCGGVYVQTRAL